MLNLPIWSSWTQIYPGHSYNPYKVQSKHQFFFLPLRQLSAFFVFIFFLSLYLATSFSISIPSFNFVPSFFLSLFFLTFCIYRSFWIMVGSSWWKFLCQHNWIEMGWNTFLWQISKTIDPKINLASQKNLRKHFPEILMLGVWTDKFLSKWAQKNVGANGIFNYLLQLMRLIRFWCKIPLLCWNIFKAYVSGLCSNHVITM